MIKLYAIILSLTVTIANAGFFSWGVIQSNKSSNQPDANFRAPKLTVKNLLNNLRTFDTIYAMIQQEKNPKKSDNLKKQALNLLTTAMGLPNVFDSNGIQKDIPTQDSIEKALTTLRQLKFSEDEIAQLEKFLDKDIHLFVFFMYYVNTQDSKTQPKSSNTIHDKLQFFGVNNTEHPSLIVLAKQYILLKAASLSQDLDTINQNYVDLLTYTLTNYADSIKNLDPNNEKRPIIAKKIDLLQLKQSAIPALPGELKNSYDIIKQTPLGPHQTNIDNIYTTIINDIKNRFIQGFDNSPDSSENKFISACLLLEIIPILDKHFANASLTQDDVNKIKSNLSKNLTTAKSLYKQKNHTYLEQAKNFISQNIDNFVKESPYTIID